MNDRLVLWLRSVALFAGVAWAAGCSSPRADLASLAERPALPASVLLSGGAFLGPGTVASDVDGEAVSPLVSTFAGPDQPPEALALGEVAATMIDARVFVRLEVDAGDRPAERRRLAERRGNLPLQDPEVAALLERARAGGHDYVLVLHRLQDGAVEEYGINERWPLTLATWFLVGLGFLVPDHTFGSEATLQAALFEVYTGREVHRSVGSPGTIDLSLLDRTDGWGLISSILIPPFWVGNDEERVVREVRSAAERRITAALARELKSAGCRQDLEERARASFALRTDAEGQLGIEIRSALGIRLVALRADGVPVDDALQSRVEAALLGSERQEDGGYVYEGQVPPELGGRFLQVIAQTVSGDAASATFDRRSGSSTGL